VPAIDGALTNYRATIDKLDGEWSSAVTSDHEGNLLDINTLMFGVNESATGNHWAAMHDGVYLYLLVLSDDAGLHFFDTDETLKPWKDDSVEIFIDGNYSRLSEYDGVDDFGLTINLLDSTGAANSSYVNNPELLQHLNSATLPPDLIFSTGPLRGPISSNINRGRKDLYEIRLKISELNIQVGELFGIEFQINDDDDGNTRDSKLAWQHPPGNDSSNDLTWQTPSTMGSALLLP